MPMARRYGRCLLALIYTMALLSGCFNSPLPGEDSQESPSASPAETGQMSGPKIELMVFQYNPELKDAYQEVVRSFSESYQEINLTVESLEAGKDYRQELKARFSAGNMPDVFNIGSPQDIITYKDILLDLSSTAAAQFVIDGLNRDMTVEGTVYGLPYCLEGYGLVYNTEMFEKAQIDVKTIDSFQALEIAVKKLDDQKKDLGIDAVFAFAAKEYVETGLYLSNLFISPEFEGDAFKTYYAKSIAFKYGESFKKMVDLFNQYSVQPAYEIDYKKQIEELFIEEKVAMIQQGSWVAKTFENLDKDILQKVGFMPFPVEGYMEDANPIGVPMYWAVNKERPWEVQKAAQDFINWLYLTEDGQDAIADTLKFIPPYKGFAADSVSDPLSKYILYQVSSQKRINWIFDAYPEDWGLLTLGPGISAYIQGKLSWDALLANARQDWEQKRNQQQ